MINRYHKSNKIQDVFFIIFFKNFLENYDKKDNALTNEFFVSH